MNRPNYIAVNKPPVRSASGKYYQVNQIQPGQGKLLYVANEKRCVRVLPRNVSSSTAPLPTPIEPSKPLVSLPPCMPTHLLESSREPLRESSVNNCVPSRIRFPKNYRMQGSELTKIHSRNAWLKNSITAPHPTSQPLADASDSEEEDLSDEEKEHRSRHSLFYRRHRYYSESETSITKWNPDSSDYDEDEEDSPRSSPLFHHRHRYNSDSETPYYSPYSEDSVDNCASSALAHHSKTSESSDQQDDFSALTNKESIPASFCTSPSLQDLVPDSEEEPSPSSYTPKFPLCDNPSGPLAQVKNESRPRFLGVKQVNLKGRHDVLVYSIPDTDNAYVFCHERTNVDYQIFKCFKCWNEKVKTTVKVIGNEFFGNPCELGHICTPVDELEDRVERLTYKWLTDLQEQSKSCPNAPKEEYANFLIWLRDDSDKDEWTRKALLNTFKQSGGYKEHQELFARFCKPKKARIDDHIEQFVQQSLLMHASYREEHMECKDSEMDESFRPECISTMEVLEWVAGMSENETFYTF